VFANLSNQIYEREMLKILLLYYPSLDTSNKKAASSTTTIKPVKNMKIMKKELVPGGVVDQHLKAIAAVTNTIYNLMTIKSNVIRWGKLRLNAKTLIHNQLSDSRSVQNETTRYS
jgi:hypothetical protein